jgi:hypothetical protein
MATDPYTSEEYAEYYKDIKKAQGGKVAAGVGKGALSGAATGASVGSAVLPGIGTAIGAAGGAIIGGIVGGATNAATAAEKRNNAKLAELLRKEEMGLLGLSEEEKQSLYEEQLGAVSKAARDVRAEQSGVAASLAQGAGRAAIDRAIQEESVTRSRATAERFIAAKDLDEKNRQLAEIETRLGVISDQQNANRQSMQDTAYSAMQQAAAEAERIKTVRGAKPSPEQLTALSAYTGMSEDQLGPALEYFASNPESAQILNEMLQQGSTGVVGAQ